MRRILSGKVTIGEAKSTGLVPAGKRIKNDKPEGSIDLAKLDFSCPVYDDTGLISGEEMMKRAEEAGAIGSLGLGAVLLKAQAEGAEIFPVESRGEHRFLLPSTLLEDELSHDPCIGQFFWNGQCWELDFDFFGDFSEAERFIRLGK